MLGLLIASGSRAAETHGFLLQRLLDSWYPLWTLLFQPALGVLMLGAVGYSSLYQRLWDVDVVIVVHAV